jgi:hypothetical protein
VVAVVLRCVRRDVVGGGWRKLSMSVGYCCATDIGIASIHSHIREDH